MANSLSAHFPKAVHVRCFLHLKGYIEHKLSELIIPASVDDIMGKPPKFQRYSGLLDTRDPTHLDEMLTKLQSVRNDQEKPFNSPTIFSHGFNSIYQQSVTAVNGSKRVH